MLNKLWGAFVSSTFGSDELQSYSAEYTWLANQMAHAMMGFFLATLWYRFTVPTLSKLWWVPPLIPVLKLPFDALAVGTLSSPFPVVWAEFLQDKATDLCFWFLGMFLAYVSFYDGPVFRRRWRSPTAWAALTVWAVIAVWLASEWTTQKQVFDRSGLPPGWVRVSQYDTRKVYGPDATPQRTKMEQGVTRYLQFIRDDRPASVVHLVIRGGRAADRSDLAVALGTEFAARSKGVYYHTAGRLLEDPRQLDRWRPEGGGDLPESDPRYPRCVVIDDWVGLAPELADVALAGPVPLPPGAGVYSLSQDERIRVVFGTLTRWGRDEHRPVSIVWVLGCDRAEADRWLRTIHRCLDGPGQEVIEVDLGPHDGPPSVVPRAIY